MDGLRYRNEEHNWGARRTAKQWSRSWGSGAESPRAPNIGGARIFIGGLAESIEEEHLWEYFNHLCESSGCKGRVMSVEASGTKGYGFVTFDNIDAVSVILKER